MKSWNKIRKAATAFSKRWKNAYDEKAQAQSFLKEFFAVFGVDTVVFNAFEHRVKFSDGSQGYADCFWQGKILVEMKSRGKDLDNAYSQAMDYVRTLQPADYPRAVVVSDFARVRFYDLAHDAALTEFALKDLRKYVTLFGYMIGVEDAKLFRLGVMMSRMHNAWVRAVCGRLESRYRYSKDIVYNNFVWPGTENLSSFSGGKRIYGIIPST